MTNDELIDEHIMILLNIFNNNYKHLTWGHVKIMLESALLLGIELGKKQVYMSQQGKGARKK